MTSKGPNGRDKPSDATRYNMRAGVALLAWRAGRGVSAPDSGVLLLRSKCSFIRIYSCPHRGPQGRLAYLPYVWALRCMASTAPSTPAYVSTGTQAGLNAFVLVSTEAWLQGVMPAARNH